MRRSLKIALMVVVLLLAFVGTVVFLAYRATQSVPEFYQQAISVTPEETPNAGEKFERQVLELRNEARQDGRWQVVFTDAQINGWLTSELPNKFPQLLPPEIDSPRVAILSQRIKLGCRYRHKSISTVLSLELEPHLTETANELAIRIRGAQAGSVPVPLRELIERATQAAHKAEVLLRWQQADGDPVALITISELDQESAESKMVLEAIELRTGELVITGRTEIKSDSPSSPAIAN